MAEQDRIAIEEAALVLAAIAELARTDEVFGRKISHLPVPGGKEIFRFASAIGATAARYPTDWVLARRRASEEAA